MAGLKIDNLSDSLLEYLEGLGLSEEQVQQLIDNISGDLSALQTTDKSSLVAAINELFQNANNGKELIATAIGEPLTAEDTFNAMSNDINNLLSTFKANMMNNGVSVESTDKFKQLIDKIATMIEEGSGKGIQYATGTYTCNQSVGKNESFNVPINLDFVPTIVFVVKLFDSGNSVDPGPYNYILTNNNIASFLTPLSGDARYPDRYKISSVDNLNITITLVDVKELHGTRTFGECTWYAIGVGEEDTTLEDSLRDILANKGVELTGNETLSELILKVDEISGAVKLTASDNEFIYQNTNYSTFENHNNTYSIVYKMTTTFTGSVRCSIPIRTSNTSYYAYVLFEQLRGNIVIFSKEDKMNSADYTTMTCDINNIQLGDIIQISVKTSSTNTSYYAQTKAPTVSATMIKETEVNMSFDINQLVCSDGGSNFMLKNDGSLWVCGQNNYGQLGLGDTNVRPLFTQLDIDNVKSIAPGTNHTIILKNDGTIWGTGYDYNGPLGLGTTNNQTPYTNFIQLPIDSVKKVIAGRDNTIVLKNDGTLWVSGGNGYYQLGTGDGTKTNTFTQISTNVSDVKDIATGGYHTVILKNDGTIWSTGANEKGELGLGNTNSMKIFTQSTTIDSVESIYCSYNTTFAFKTDGTLWVSGNGEYGKNGLATRDAIDTSSFTQITTNVDDIKKISCGYNHTFLLKNDGSLYSCGNNTRYQLGFDTSDSNAHTTFTKLDLITDAIDVYCGCYYTLILRSDGTLWGCGIDTNGQVGLGYISDQSTLKQIKYLGMMV